MLKRCMVIVVALLAMSAAAPAPAELQIHGQVVDGDGKPAALAQVYAVKNTPEGNEFLAQGVCDGAGQFSFRVSEQPEKLFAVLPGVGITKSAAYADGPLQLMLEPRVDAEVTLLAPDGKPAAGVEVHVAGLIFEEAGKPFGGFLDFRAKLSGIFSAKTDADGKCVLRGLPLNGHATLDTYDEQFAHFSYRAGAQLDGVDPVVKVPPIQLRKAAEIEGQLLAPDTGKPWAGAPIDVQSTNADPLGFGGAGVSDQAGSFSVTRLGPGLYVVSLGEEHETPNPWVAPAQEITLTEGQTATAHFQLTRGGILKGQVRDATTGKGLAGVGVGLQGSGKPADAASVYFRTADSDGRFEFRVPPGEQHPYIGGPIPAGYEHPASQGMKLIAVKESETVEFTFDLKRDASHLVRGTVIGPDGKAAPGATVLMEDTSADEMSAPITADDKGNFEIMAKDGTLLRARLKGMGTLAPLRIAGDDPVELRLVTDPSFTEIVELVDADGNPVPVATANLFSQNGRFGMGGQPRKADKDGFVRFEGLEMDGRYSIMAQAPGYGTAGGKVRSPQPDGPRESTTAIRLRKADAKIAGVVVDAQGNPVAGVQIYINGGSTGYQEIESDKQGKFSFQVVSDAMPLICVRTAKGASVGATNVRAGDEAVKIVFTGETAKIEPSIKNKDR